MNGRGADLFPESQFYQAARQKKRVIATSREPISDDLMAWLALRRVNEGGVTLLDGSYYHHGRPVPNYLNAPLAALVENGHLRLDKADPDMAGMQRIIFTLEGRDRYSVLCGKRGVSSESVCRSVRGDGTGRESDRPPRQVLPVMHRLGGSMMSAVTEWLALHQAYEGSALKLNSNYVNADGRPVVDLLDAAFDELIGSGLLALGQPDPLGYQRVCVTHTGQTRYAELRNTALKTVRKPDEQGKHRQPERNDSSR